MEDGVFSDAMLSKILFIFGNLAGIFEGRRRKVNQSHTIVHDTT